MLKTRPLLVALAVTVPLVAPATRAFANDPVGECQHVQIDSPAPRTGDPGLRVCPPGAVIWEASTTL